MLFKPKLTPEPKRQPLPPQAIIDGIEDDLTELREHHSSEIMRLRTIIEDATERLENHMIAHKALETAMLELNANTALSMSDIPDLLKFEDTGQ